MASRHHPLRARSPAPLPEIHLKQGLWPVERLMLAYLLAIGTMVAVCHGNVAHSGAILIAHAAGMFLIAAFAIIPRLPGTAPVRGLLLPRDGCDHRFHSRHKL
jgi:hypothetical protein